MKAFVATVLFASALFPGAAPAARATECGADTNLTDKNIPEGSTGSTTPAAGTAPGAQGSSTAASPKKP